MPWANGRLKKLMAVLGKSQAVVASSTGPLHPLPLHWALLWLGCIGLMRRFGLNVGVLWVRRASFLRKPRCQMVVWTWVWKRCALGVARPCEGLAASMLRSKTANKARNETTTPACVSTCLQTCSSGRAQPLPTSHSGSLVHLGATTSTKPQTKGTSPGHPVEMPQVRCCMCPVTVCPVRSSKLCWSYARSMAVGVSPVPCPAKD